MFFQWPAKKPELQGNRRCDRRWQSADDIALGGFLNLDGTCNETFRKLIENEPLPQPGYPSAASLSAQRGERAATLETRRATAR